MIQNRGIYLIELQTLQIIEPLINLRSMGQQIALQEKSQNTQDLTISSSRCQSINNDNQYIPKQGILKISINPFPYASRIGSTINGLPIYAEKSKSLSQQTIERTKQMNFFTQDQMLDFIESIIYTLASYQQQNIIYKDLCSQNIFLTRVNQRNQISPKIQFKLLPNPLVQQTTYQKFCNLKQKRISDQSHSFNFSPQMIIAYRARQKLFNDLALLKKSNVFALGMVFLQATTLHSSRQFYDEVTFDIFQQTIQERLVQIEKRYGSIIVKIIANMIDFDFEERIQGFVELAKWIIVQLENMRNQQLMQENHKLKNPLTPLIPQSPKCVSSKNVNRSNKIRQVQEQIQMMPVCHQKMYQGQMKIKNKQKMKIQQSQVNKQNESSQNKIKITIREVPVYLQKNQRVKNEKQNKARLMYSPFVNTNRSSQFSSYQRTKIDMLTHTKRSLAFQQTKSQTRNLFNQFNAKNLTSRTQR